MNAAVGTVSLVGAGPGDPGITNHTRMSSKPSRCSRTR